LDKAKALADKIVAVLAPACDRLEIAGSIRRRQQFVGDVEIVAIPKREGLLEDTVQLDRLLRGLVASGKLHLIKNGDKYKQFAILKAGINLDLFLCEPETWGVCLTIRTGPATFSKRMVTQQFMGGNLPNDLRVHELRVWRGDTALETPGEGDFFKIAEAVYVPPEERR